MAPQGGGGNDYSDAKDLLDKIGQQVYEQVKKEVYGTAKKYIEKLKGNLQHATNINQELVGSPDPCELVKQYYNNHVNGGAARGERDPCKGLSAINVERFSDKIGGQCTKEKISGSTNTCGACAPYRRLHLCHHNLETIETTSTTKHDLLLEVCMAAKYEGNSIERYYTGHQLTNNDSASQLCTVLARSFADIGDIVRGRDLFYGNTQEKEKREDLEKKLKEIFKQIHDNLKDEEAEKHYKGDTDGNYYKLREDWWTANRHTVWEALTCDVKDNIYFRATCNGEERTKGYCRCGDGKKPDDQVPTYFDYVPQFLRWFEEWAEDFCRLRKRKLENAKNKCRRPKGQHKYCDLNRYDCEKTASGKHDFFEEDVCKDCQYSCARFVKWIDNQKLEFLKQRNKYQTEISNSGSCGGSGRKKRGASTTNYDGYEKKFYDKLEKNKYVKVGEFLDLLSKETTCTKKLKDVDEEEGTINFKTVKRSSAKNGDGSNKTFYRTTYCEACPWCGAEPQSDGGWKAKEGNCSQTKDYDPEKTTTIEILTGDTRKSDMVQKYNKFCNGNGGNGAPGTANGGAQGGKGKNGASGKNDNQIVTWQCYYDENETKSEKNNNCVQGKWENFTGKQTVKSYNAFFWDWVHDMLHDSLEWRERLNSCINNAKSQNCKNNEKCNKECGCFEKWVKQKKEKEWEAIKDHFKKQKDIEQQTETDPGVTLQWVLILEFLNEKSAQDKQNSLDAEEAKEIQHLKKMLKEANIDVDKFMVGVGSDDAGTGKKTIMDELLNHEERIAKKCKETHTNDICLIPNSGGGRSGGPPAVQPAVPSPPGRPPPADGAGDEDDEDEEDDDELSDEDEPVETAKKEEKETHKTTVDTGQTPAAPTVDVCNTVAKIFEDNTTLQKACALKYGPKAPTSWKCVTPSGADSTTSGEGSEATSSHPRSKRDTSTVTTTRGSGATTGVTTTGSSGSICVPPRRRKLYLGGFDKFISGETTRGSTPATSQSPNGDLLTAFVESAAVETFFLWHRYKKEWMAQKAEELQRQRESEGLPLPRAQEGSQEDDPQSKLEKGEIPPDFLRLMFYTLGDYRDILFSGSKDAKNGVNYIISGDKEMADREKEIKEKIKTFFSNSGNKENSVPQNSGKDPKTWWDKNAQHIWKGMVCALTYKENEVKNPDGKNTYKIEQIQDTNGNGDPFQELKKKYSDYKTVKLEEEASGAKPNQTPSTSGDNTPTTLDSFIKRPPYFRYLHEWGQNFCKKRTEMLGKIKEECRSHRGGHEYCSGDGYDCEQIDPKNYNIFKNLDCRDCYEKCRNYKIWIQKKGKEFNEQKNKYVNELQKVNTTYNDNRDKEFYQNLNKNYTSVDQFLDSLKYCKDGQVNNDKNNKIDFKNPENTFNPSTYCKACPIYGVNCNANKRVRIGNNACSENELPNAANTVDGEPTTIPIVINDGATDNTDEKLKETCKQYELYKNLRKQNWKCQKKNDEVHECNLNGAANSVKSPTSVKYKYYDEKIPFNILFERWLIDFIQYYNKSKERINLCTKDGEKQCIQGCKGNCDCVEEWLNKKEQEWNIIKQYYKQNFQSADERIASRTKSFFEQQPFDSYADEAKKVVEGQNEQKKLWGCTGDNLKDDEKPENCNKGDFITNLIDKLKDKIQTCKENHNPSGKSGQTCETPHTPDENPDTHDETESTPEDNQSPAFCPPPEPPMTCVEKVAKELREEAEGKVSDELKGKGIELNGKCNDIHKIIDKDNAGNFTKIKEDELLKIFPLMEECEKKGKDRFLKKTTWKCYNIQRKGINLCLPPRRQYMCTKPMNEMTRAYNSDNDALLKAIMETAQNEGINILRRINVQDLKKFPDICDAMKYSFADLADIIRGTDLWNTDPKQKRIQKKLELIFEKFNENLKNKNEKKYEYDNPKYLNLRSDWWDVNRKEVWKAMTCVAPNDSKFFKKDEKISSGSSSSNGVMSNAPKCGYNSEPPDYDYIPQPFRWMQEWSEYYCKLLNEEMEQFEKTCGECKNESNKCKNNIEKCNKCRDQCKNYKKLVNEWKDQIAKHDFKYKELYDKSKENENSGGFLDDYTKQFIEQMKEQCNDPKTVDEYLDKSNNCINFTFRKDDQNDTKYAFKETPNDYVNACNCDPTDILHECPFKNGNQDACKSISTENICKKKNFDNDLDDWNSGDIPESTSKNNGVLVPPRRRQLCIQNITSNLNSIQNKDDFKKNLIQAAYTEAYFLREKYVNNEKAIQAMKYSFYDYGDIVKGTDMLDNYFLNKLKKKIDEFLRENDSNNISDNRKKWWIGNKNRVWYAMLCGYNKAGGEIKSTECVVPKEDEQTPQFLRWFQEWTESFCSRRNELYEKVRNICESAQCNKENGRINSEICKRICEEYRNYISKKKQEYQFLNYQYNKNFMNDKAEGKKAPQYFNEKCSNKYGCLSENFSDYKKWENPYETLGNDTLKNKCDCIKTEAPPEGKLVPDQDPTKKEEIPPARPAKPDVPAPEKPLPPPTPSTDNISDILSTTIPLGIALALGSIAFLFMK
ncbi:hypothetical protein PFFCH_05562, partial [Plasmodium falciparum FCH/4]